MKTDSSGKNALLDQLVDEFAEAYRRGEHPSLQAYLDRYPDLADEIRELFPALIEMEQGKEDRRAPDEPAPAGRSAPPEQIGDFHILREIGRGGMGIVYEAEQVSLGRHVALKVLPGHAPHDPRHLHRFECEARAAAKLHHTNIVPVYGVGEQDGLHYYVMQFIQGLGLDQVLEELKKLQLGHAKTGSFTGGELCVGRSEMSAVQVAHSLLTGEFQEASGGREPPDSSLPKNLGAHAPRSPSLNRDDSKSRQRKPTYWQNVAQIGVQVAEALEYANSQGILHRDIKPSNLLLDTRGTVWVTDFGLAKAADSKDLTHTGDIVGTLRYLAPERFQGQADVRSDVYALGLTLYELLTLRPAFDETEKNKLVSQVMHAEPRRPRQLEPGVPRDLETVVLKAMDRDPGRRYQTAAELAEDLRRFVAGMPIQARPTPAWEQVWKWARRRPAVAALVAVSAVAALAVVGAGIALWYNARLDSLNGNLEQALQETQAQRQQTEQVLDQLHQQQYFHYIARAQAGWLDGNMGAVDAMLERCPADQRGWEWQYLKRQCHTDLLTLAGNGERVESVAFNPDGTRLASAGWNQVVHVWDVATGQELLHLKGHKATISGVAFSPDGTRLVSGDNKGSLHVWDARTGQHMYPLEAGIAVASNPAFSPDSKRLATGCLSSGAIRTLILWDLTTRQKTRVMYHPESTRVGHWLKGVAFSPDGARLASAAHDGVISLWDVRPGQDVPPAVAAFAPAGVMEGLTGFAHATTGVPLRLLTEHTDKVHSVVFSPDGTRLASGSGDYTARIWDARTGQVLLTCRDHKADVKRVAYSPDGKWLATASFDRTVKLWDAVTGQVVRTFKGHTEPVYGLAFSPDGIRLVSSSDDGTVKFWGVSTDPEAHTLTSPYSVTSVAFSPDGRQLASAGMDGVRLWAVQTGQIRCTWEAREAPSGQPRSKGRRFNQVAFSPDGKYLAAGGETLKVWDGMTCQEIHTLPGHTKEVTSVAFSPDGTRLVSASKDNIVKIWNLTTGKELLTFTAHPSAGAKVAISKVVFSPDGRRLATSGYGDPTGVRIWDVATGVLLRTPQEPGSGLGGCVAFSPDWGRFAAAGAGRGTLVTVWDTTTGQLIHELHGHTDMVRAVAFTPDGTRIASAGTDRTMKIWDARTGQELLTLESNSANYEANTGSVAFSPDGTCLASAGLEGTIKIWDARPWTPDEQAGQQARDLLACLVAKPLSHQDIRAHLSRTATIRQEVRDQALALLEHYPEPSDPEAYGRASWAIVRQPYLNAFQYDFALQQAETACRLSPEPARYRTTLGAAQYRTGRYGAALATLTQAEQAAENTPATLAFLALTQHRLGEVEQARKTLARLREALRSPAAVNREATDLLREVEGL
jgi:WD40 repeat protein/serine/threonine protein kinase